MGYRSEVVFKLSEAAEQGLLHVAELDPELKELLKNMHDEAATISDTSEGVYYYEWVKWYPGDPQVDMIMDFFKQLDSEGREDEYGFIRLGEDDSDVELLGSPFDLGLEYTRNVRF